MIVKEFHARVLRREANPKALKPMVVVRSNECSDTTTQLELVSNKCWFISSSNRLIACLPGISISIDVECDPVVKIFRSWPHQTCTLQDKLPLPQTPPTLHFSPRAQNQTRDVYNHSCRDGQRALSHRSLFPSHQGWRFRVCFRLHSPRAFHDADCRRGYRGANQTSSFEPQRCP